MNVHFVSCPCDLFFSAAVASHVMVAPFGMETLHFLAVLIPQIYGETGWMHKGRCPIIGAVACKKDDPVSVLFITL